MFWFRFLLLFFIILAMNEQVCRADNNEVADRIERPVRKAIDIRQKSQKEQEKWRDERQKRIALYESLKQKEAELKDRQKAMIENKTALEGRIEAKTIQLERIQQISEQIMPYLQDVMIQLHNFYDNDIPFLTEERQRRIERLEQMMAEPDVTMSEKMRKIMEALIVEAEYGHTIEVYRETINVKGHEILVDILRLGRIALFYQSLDNRSCGFFNVAEGIWQPLPGDYNDAIQTAMEIGSKRRPVEILNLPIGRIEPQ